MERSDYLKLSMAQREYQQPREAGKDR